MYISHNLNPPIPKKCNNRDVLFGLSNFCSLNFLYLGRFGWHESFSFTFVMLIYCVFGIILFDTMNSSLSLPQFELSQYVAEVMSQNAGHAAQRCSSRPPDTWPISVKVRICWNIGQFVYCCIHFSADYIYIYLLVESSQNTSGILPKTSADFVFLSQSKFFDFHLIWLFFQRNGSSQHDPPYVSIHRSVSEKPISN